MRASTARLMNSPVRLADLTFPQVNRLIHRTRLAFIHLDNLLAFGKRDRDGRVDGYLTAHLPDECLLVFFRKGEAVNAASLHSTGRQVVTITEAMQRMRAEAERGAPSTRWTRNSPARRSAAARRSAPGSSSSTGRSASCRPRVAPKRRMRSCSPRSSPRP